MSSGFGVPKMDWSPLAEIGDTLRKRSLASQLGGSLQNGDYAGASRIAFDAGDASTGLQLLKLGETHRQTLLGEKASDDLMRGLSGGGDTGGGLNPFGGGSGPRSDTSRSLPSFADTSAPSGSYTENLFRRESGGDPNAQASTSSARGLGQFVTKTWNGLARERPELGLTPVANGQDGRTDPQQMRRATGAYTEQNEGILQRSNLPIDDASRYSLHIFGPGGGRRFVAGTLANPDRPAASIVNPDQVAANRSIFFDRDGRARSAGEVMNSFRQSFSGGGAQAPRQRAPAVDVATDEDQVQALEQRMGMVPRQVASLDPRADMPMPGATPLVGRMPGLDDATAMPPGISESGRLRAVPPSSDPNARNVPGSSIAAGTPALDVPTLGGPAPNRRMTMPGDAPPVQVAQAGPDLSTIDGRREAAAVRQVQGIGSGGLGTGQKAQALMRAIANPHLPEGPRQLANTLLKQSLDESRLPDHVKEFMVAKANGWTQARTPNEYQREAKGPQSVAPGSAVLTPDGRGIDFMVPDRNRSNVSDDVEARRDAAGQLGLQPGSPAYQGYVLTGKMPREDAQPLTAGDKRAIMTAEDAMPEIEGTINTLSRAKELNGQTYTGFGAKVLGQTGTAFPGAGMLLDPKKAAATREFDQLMSMEAIQAMSRTLKGATTDTEMQRFMDILGDPTTPPEIRGRTIDRLSTLAQRHKEISTDRLNELRGGTYYQRGGGQSGAAPGGASPRALPAPSSSNRPAADQAPIAAAPPAAVEHLRQNPGLADAFDAKYGAGSAARAFGGR